MSGQPRALVVLPLVALLLGSSVALQVARDARFATDRPDEQILYVRSTELMKRLTLSYQAIAADVYWIRALQHFGRTRREDVGTSGRYELLHPLLDMATSLDPYFNIAYRFGAVFLSESPPGGPGRPDAAIALLEKGLRSSPTKWQYMQDIGFVHFWSRHDYAAAADWFRRASEVKGAPWWLKPLAATTLAQGGQRQASRILFQAIASSPDNDWMRKDALRRLRQLDAMDGRDQLRAVVRAYAERGGTAPFTWQGLTSAGVLRGTPRDPDGFVFELDESTGHVDLNRGSTLRPLPPETRGEMVPPPAPRP